MVFVAIRPKQPWVAEQVERPAEEVSYEVGVAVRFLVDHLEPVQIARRLPLIRVFLPANGGFPRTHRTPDSCGRIPRGIRSPSGMGPWPPPRTRRSLTVASRRSCRRRRIDRCAARSSASDFEPLLPLPIVVGGKNAETTRSPYRRPGLRNPSVAWSFSEAKYPRSRPAPRGSGGAAPCAG